MRIYIDNAERAVENFLLGTLVHTIPPLGAGKTENDKAVSPLKKKYKMVFAACGEFLDDYCIGLSDATIWRDSFQELGETKISQDFFGVNNWFGCGQLTKGNFIAKWEELVMAPEISRSPDSVSLWENIKAGGVDESECLSLTATIILEEGVCVLTLPLVIKWRDDTCSITSVVANPMDFLTWFPGDGIDKLPLIPTYGDGLLKREVEECRAFTEKMSVSYKTIGDYREGGIVMASPCSPNKLRAFLDRVDPSGDKVLDGEYAVGGCQSCGEYSLMPSFDSPGAKECADCEEKNVSL